MTEQQWFDKIEADFPNNYFAVCQREEDNGKFSAYVNEDYLTETFDSCEATLEAIHLELGKVKL